MAHKQSKMLQREVQNVGIEQMIKTLLALSIYALALVPNSYAGSDCKTISTAELHSIVVDNAYRLEAGRERQFSIIDARTREEYDKAHIVSAISIPSNYFEKSTGLLPGDKGTLLVVYCNDMKTGTCEEWAHKAETAGYTNILTYSEGFSVWKEKGMPVAPL